MKLIALILATALLATAAPEAPKLNDKDKIELAIARGDFYAAQADLTLAEKAVKDKRDIAIQKRDVVNALANKHRVAGYVLNIDTLSYTEEKKVPPVPAGK